MCHLCEAATEQLLAMVTVFIQSGGNPTDRALAAAGHRNRPQDLALAMGARLAYELLGPIAGLTTHVRGELVTEDEVWRRFMLERAERKTRG